MPNLLFWRSFLNCWKPIRGGIWYTFKNKRSENCSDKGHEHGTLWTCPGATRDAASSSHFSDKKQQVKHQSPENVSRTHVMSPKMLFDSGSITNVPNKCSREMKRVDIKNHVLWSETTWAKAQRRFCWSYKCLWGARPWAKGANGEARADRRNFVLWVANQTSLLKMQARYRVLNDRSLHVLKPRSPFIHAWYIFTPHW